MHWALKSGMKTWTMLILNGLLVLQNTIWTYKVSKIHVYVDIFVTVANTCNFSQWASYIHLNTKIKIMRRLIWQQSLSDLVFPVSKSEKIVKIKIPEMHYLLYTAYIYMYISRLFEQTCVIIIPALSLHHCSITT